MTDVGDSEGHGTNDIVPNFCVTITVTLIINSGVSGLYWSIVQSLYTCLWCCKAEATGRTERLWWRLRVQSAAVESVQLTAQCTGQTY